jgi:catechol 2,3-dioxygenase-like lactoylglutathione lyase family enzyme
MLGDSPAAATLPVSDIETARQFYEGVLGLTPGQMMPEDAPGAILYSSGGSMVLVYLSEFVGTNQATAATWAVGEDFDAIVQGLRDKGVTFERYDNLPDTTRDGDVHTFGELKSVWFKDPDGNILNVGNARPQ